MFVIIGDSRHGLRPPVLMPDDGLNFIFINPSTLTLAQVKQFATLVDAATFASTIPLSCQIIEISGTGRLVDQLSSPISVTPTAGRITKPIIS